MNHTSEFTSPLVIGSVVTGISREQRAVAFEQTVGAAGAALETELAAAGRNPVARRAAWKRYSQAQDAAGTAFRAAQAADHVGTCHYCQHTGPAGEFTNFNPAAAGNLACSDLGGCALRQAERGGWMPELDAMLASARADCRRAGRHECDHVWRLAQVAEDALRLDFDSAALLATALWAKP